MLLALGNGALLDDFLTLGQDELDVARVGHVGVDLDEISRRWREGGGENWIHNIHDREHGRCVSVPWGPG